MKHPGGKGTPRRKQVKKSGAAAAGDDRKLQTALKKMNVQPVTGVEEVNMFKEDGNVLHFGRPTGECRWRSRSPESEVFWFVGERSGGEMVVCSEGSIALRRGSIELLWSILPRTGSLHGIVKTVTEPGNDDDKSWV